MKEIEVVRDSPRHFYTSLSKNPDHI